MESAVCLLMTSNYHVNMIEIISILDKENIFKWNYGKLLTTFVSFEKEKRLPYTCNIHTRKHCAEFSDKHYTKQIYMHV